MKFDKTRKVGGESRRTYPQKIDNGFFTKYMSGNGLDIGYKGYEQDVVPILTSATGIEKEDLNPDGTLPLPDQSQDYVYNSHVLEHIDNYKQAIQQWYRVLKINGYMIISVPHKFLYERKNNLPSQWNQDHKRFYTPASLLKEIEESLEPNSYRIRLLEDGDEGYDYSIGPGPQHPLGQYEITLVLQKIQKPNWNLK